MTTKVEKTIEVDVPISTAYNQWTQFESFPQFMGGITEVKQISERKLRWTAEIAGVKRQWEADIVDQVPDSKIAWVATEGATNAGAVYFESLGLGRTLVRLHLEYQPEGLVEKAGDALNIVEKRAEGDLEKFKEFIESNRHESGAWRGTVHEAGVGTPGVEDAQGTRGDSGKAGVSGKAVAAGVVAAAAGAAVAAAAGAKKSSGDSEEDVQRPITDLPPTTGTTAGTTPGVPVTEVPATDGVGTARNPSTVQPVADEPVPGPGNTRVDEDVEVVRDRPTDDPLPSDLQEGTNENYKPRP